MYVSLWSNLVTASSSASSLTPAVTLQGQGPYAKRLKEAENDIKEVQKRVNEKMGASSSSLASPTIAPPVG